MDNERVYYNLMRSRQALGRKKVHDGSLERHHVTPKCLGGSDAPENLVLLTPREHFVAHLLLVRFTVGSARAKMSYALQMMTRRNPNQLRIRTARQYAEAKAAVSMNCSGPNHPAFGSKRSEGQKEQISRRMAGMGNHRFGLPPWNAGLTAATSPILKAAGEKYQRTITAHPEILAGRSHTDAAKEKIGAGHREKPKSQAHRDSLSKALRGRAPAREGIERSAAARRGVPQEKLRCPHCSKEGGRVAMLRWHFDSCKEKPWSSK